jgi:hypothetical protein
LLCLFHFERKELETFEIRSLKSFVRSFKLSNVISAAPLLLNDFSRSFFWGSVEVKLPSHILVIEQSAGGIHYLSLFASGQRVCVVEFPTPNIHSVHNFKPTEYFNLNHFFESQQCH